jgi:hypothetical protein
MSKHWKPPRTKIVRIRPAGDWTRLQSYWIGPAQRRLPEGGKAGLVLVAAACVGVAVGAYQAFAPPVVFSPGSEAEWVPPKPEIVIPEVAADPADEEWASRAESPSTGLQRASGARNDGGVQDIYVIDGDTFVLGRQKIRIANIDAPELHPPRCTEEARLGLAATAKLRTLLGSGTVTLSGSGSDHDEHGRLLRDVSVNGRDVGEAMISAGVARDYGSGRRAWC